LEYRDFYPNSLKERKFLFFILERNEIAYPFKIFGLVAQLGVDYIDLYLIHSPRLATPDIPTAWKKMEDLKNAGFVK